MAELRNGQRPTDLRLQPYPPPGFYTFSQIRNRLCETTKTRCTSNRMRKMCAELGIELYPFVRREAFMTKVYKRQLRWLTEDEARRIMELYHTQLEAWRNRYAKNR